MERMRLDMEDSWRPDPGSFRDPSGFVFWHEGVLYRQVNAPSEGQYRPLIDSGLYDELVADHLLVPHEEVSLRPSNAPPAYAVLKPQIVPFVSYPYEWCFGQLKAAALVTLDIQKRAMRRGLTLRDASAFNVQFIGTHPVFIDTLSFGTLDAERPWAAYRQFCRHFLAPLAAVALVDPELGRLSRLHIDGFPLELACRLLPARSWMRPGLAVHLHLHGRTGGDGAAEPSAAPGRMGRTALLGLIDSLERAVHRLTWTPPETLWSAYSVQCNYSEAAQRQKHQLVAAMLDAVGSQSRLETVWDFGANT
jgi:hypothetical protein